MILTCPKLPPHLTAEEVEAVLDYAARHGADEAIAQAVLNELRQDQTDVEIAHRELALCPRPPTG